MNELAQDIFVMLVDSDSGIYDEEHFERLAEQAYEAAAAFLKVKELHDEKSRVFTSSEAL